MSVFRDAWISATSGDTPLHIALLVYPMSVVAWTIAYAVSGGFRE